MRTSRTITTRTFGCLGISRTITTRTITTRTVFQNHTKGTTVSHIFASEVCRTLRNSILLTYCIQMAGGPAARFADKSQVAETIRSHSSSPWHSFVPIFPAPRPGILWITQFSIEYKSNQIHDGQGPWDAMVSIGHHGPWSPREPWTPCNTMDSIKYHEIHCLPWSPWRTIEPIVLYRIP